MFKKKYMIIALIGMLPLSAMAAGDNVGGCGWGSKVFNGKRGLMPNAMAAIANSLFSINTFGMSSGTMGCSADGVIRSNWKTAMFIDGNKSKLAQDMSTGGGEALESLANLIGVQAQHKTAFFQLTKDNFARIFSADNQSTDQVVASLKQVLAADNQLAQYSQSI